MERIYIPLVISFIFSLRENCQTFIPFVFLMRSRKITDLHFSKLIHTSDLKPNEAPFEIYICLEIDYMYHMQVWNTHMFMLEAVEYMINTERSANTFWKATIIVEKYLNSMARLSPLLVKLFSFVKCLTSVQKQLRPFCSTVFVENKKSYTHLVFGFESLRFFYTSIALIYVVKSLKICPATVY